MGMNWELTHRVGLVRSHVSNPSTHGANGELEPRIRESGLALILAATILVGNVAILVGL